MRSRLPKATMTTRVIRVKSVTFRRYRPHFSATVGLGNIGGVAVAVFSRWTGSRRLDDSCWIPWDDLKIHRMHSRSNVPKSRRERTSPRWSDAVPIERSCRNEPWTSRQKFLHSYSSSSVSEEVSAVATCTNPINLNSAVKEAIPFFADKAWLYGLIMAFMVGLVILGGIKRIGTAAALIVPFMCLIYVLGGLFIIIYTRQSHPHSFRNHVL